MLALVLAAGVLAAGGWLGWHLLHRGSGGGRQAVRTCVTPTPAPTPAEPSSVTVAVLNATDKVGMAHQVAAALRAEHVPGAALTEVATGGVTLRLGPSFAGLATDAQVSAAHAKNLASASPRPAVCPSS
jgi:hypothetical protein